MNEKFNDLCNKRDSVVIFRNTGADPVIRNLLYLIEADTSNISEFLSYYSDFVESLYENTVNLSEYVLKTILECENMYIVKVAEGKTPDPMVYDCLIHELEFFQELSQLTPDDFIENAEYDGYLPQWTTSDIDFIGSYTERARLINHYGYGKYAKNKMFILRQGEIMEVKHPDTQKLSELYGYERERSEVIKNTLALLDGKNAQNVLLYGDAGTGKSSTVKALVNEYCEKGLRLIEITKEQLSDIPLIIDEISSNPLKFIIFIDDLSFSSGEDCFGALKAMLEGSVSAKAKNAVIYATSNRRHLIKECFSDREGDDIHRNDTMQEMLSLSARFGLRINFSRPDKKNYLSIVKKLAKQHNIKTEKSELELKAEQFAISSGNGRSPRTAKQFIYQLINEN